MKTIKLYDNDSYISRFNAVVVDCIKKEDSYAVILDRTAFFPEGGGQSSDTGFIDGIKVSDAQIKDNVIEHFTISPVTIGKKVDCEINWDERFQKMQAHSGEHIFSGIAHNLFGCENVGFHSGEDVTIDFDKELNKQQIEQIENLSNRAIYQNVEITARYPSPDELKEIDYRSKLELTENVRIVRIVTIDGYDCCACCAPHVKRTGEIGIIKVISYMRHRGGTRLFLKMGFDALRDIQVKFDNLSKIAIALCAKNNETAEVFKKYTNDVAAMKQTITSLKKELADLKCSDFEDTKDNVVIFEDDLDMPTLRNIVLKGAKHTSAICIGFSGSDSNGYIYAASSDSMDLRNYAKKINSALSGKGGGSSELIQGSVKAERTTIEKFISEE